MAEARSPLETAFKGILDLNWSEKLAEMEIYHYKSDTDTISTLTGKIIDQSELLGVLNALNDYQYKIISVNKINN